MSIFIVMIISFLLPVDINASVAKPKDRGDKKDCPIIKAAELYDVLFGSTGIVHSKLHDFIRINKKPVVKFPKLTSLFKDKNSSLETSIPASGGDVDVNQGDCYYPFTYMGKKMGAWVEFKSR